MHQSACLLGKIRKCSKLVKMKDAYGDLGYCNIFHPFFLVHNDANCSQNAILTKKIAQKEQQTRKTL